MLKRIIPKLEIKNSNLVKGINLEGLRVLGDPLDFAKCYYNDLADEIIYHDVVASLYGRNLISEFIKKVSQEVFIPMCVGGGIRNIEDIETAMKSGADKAFINSAALMDESFLKNSVKKFGSSNIVVNIEAIKIDNKYFASYENGRTISDKEINKWINFCQDNGAGEVIITSISQDGTGDGFDKKLLDYIIFEKIKIPVILQGGFGDLNNFINIKDYLNNLDGFSISSSLHYYLIKNKKIVHKDFSQGNTDYIQSGKLPSRFNYYSIEEIKNYLVNEQIKVRLE